jgi:hypothetical protein
MDSDFNAFHCVVAGISTRLRWVIGQLEPQDFDTQAGVEVLAVLLDDLDSLVEGAAPIVGDARELSRLAGA